MNELIKTAKMTFEQIVRGKGKWHNGEKAIVLPIMCRDGTSMSIQASQIHFCKPRDDFGPYTAVEVLFESPELSKAWEEYGTDVTLLGLPGVLFLDVPVKLVRAYIEVHGGETNQGEIVTATGRLGASDE